MSKEANKPRDREQNSVFVGRRPTMNFKEPILKRN